jgi:iron(III) transport system permease protein
VLLEAGLESWEQVLASSRWLEASGHTLLLVLLSTLFSVITGFVFAYGVIRGGLPFSKFFAFIPILHLVTPPFVGGLSFILLFGRQGLFTKQLFHLDISLYGLPGLLIAQTLSFFPIAFLIIRGAFEGINPSLEYAARAAGAGRLRVFRTITLPLSMPGVLSAMLFIAISVLSDFGNPMLIGGRYNVLAVELFTQLSGWANISTSAVLGIILLIPALILFVLQRILLYKKGGRFATIGTRGSSMPLPLPSLPVRIALFLFCALVSLIVVAQFVSIIDGAFSRVWGVDSTFTLDHLRASFSHQEELLNTLSFSLLAAAGTAALAAIFAFLIQRTELPLRGLVDSLVMVPAAIPGSLIGLSYILAFNGKLLHFTGTRFIIVIVIIICDLPAGYLILSSSIMRIRMSLDDSARALGASRLRLFFTIICPLVIRGIVSAFVFTFVRATGTLSAVLFLMSFHSKIISVVILSLATVGDWGGAASLALILTVVIFASLGILRLVSGKQFFKDIFDR